jgi:intermembrane space import and assembly protein 40
VLLPAALAAVRFQEEEQLDRRIEQALECPCVDDLKAGPCGELFVTTFTCYHKSRAEPKGCDCLTVSLAFAVGVLYIIRLAGAYSLLTT